MKEETEFTLLELHGKLVEGAGDKGHRLVLYTACNIVKMTRG